MAEQCPLIYKTNEFCTLFEHGEYKSIPYPCTEIDYACLENLAKIGQDSDFDFWNLMYIAIGFFGFFALGALGYYFRLAYIRFFILKSEATIWILFLASFGVTIRANEPQTRDIEAQNQPSAPLDMPE